MPSFPFSHRRNESDGVFDLEEAEPLATLSNSSGEDDQHLYENDSPSTFPSSRLPSSRLRNRSKPSLIQLAYDHKWVIFALVFGVVVGQVRWRYQDEQLRSASVLAAMVVKSGDVRPGIWEPVDGGQGLAAVGTKQERPVGMQECKRTLLFDWARFEYGFGSTATTFLQAGFFAKTHGYTMLVSRGANAYGSLLDHFDPPPLDCWADEEWYTPERYQHPIHEQETRHAYHIIEGIQKGETPQKEIDRVLVDTDDLYPLNFFARNATFQLPELDSLPELNSQRPFPAFSNIPEIFKQRFLQYSNIANEYFSLNGLMRARVSGMIAEHKLDKPRDSPTVGIHYRGGDKLLMECVPSAQISCGNITLHCETALDSLSAVSHLYPSMDLSSASTTKPRILLMSAEPDALASFQADSLCQKFEVVALGQGGTHKPFVQSEFQQLSAADRLEDARLLLSEGDLLTNFVDTAVVSANSNSARIMFARAGPARVLDEHRMRTVDIYWHPVQFPPFKGKCPGEWGTCWPDA